MFASRSHQWERVEQHGPDADFELLACNVRPRAVAGLGQQLARRDARHRARDAERELQGCHCLLQVKICTNEYRLQHDAT